MTAVEMEVGNGASEGMDVESQMSDRSSEEKGGDNSDSSSSSGSNDDEEGQGKEAQGDAMEDGSDDGHKAGNTNPAFSEFMRGFWDLASVDVPVRWVGGWLAAVFCHLFLRQHSTTT